jgi:MFS family permease
VLCLPKFQRLGEFICSSGIVARWFSPDQKEEDQLTAMTRTKEHELSSPEVRTLSLAAIGGTLEFYDFIIFVFFADVLGKLFFAASLPDWARQAQTFGIFAAGYLVRPLGGIVMAHLGDRQGRKRIFMLSIVLMAIPTLLIGVLPTYRSIGVAAPLLLLLMRMLQGLAIGGEAPGAWVFVAEHARRGRVGFAVGLLTGGLSLGILLGSLIATLFGKALTPAQIAGGGWRIPFLLGGVFGLIAAWLRRWLRETPVFEQMRKRMALSRELPLGIVLRQHRRAVITGMIATWMLTAAILVEILMPSALLPKLYGFAAAQVHVANMTATAALCLSSVAMGAATDRFGVRRMAGPMMLLLMVSSLALYAGAAAHVSSLLLLYTFAGLGAGGAVLAPIMMIQAFPEAVRFTGVSFSYNIAYALAGGLTPLLVSSIIHFSLVGPAYYVVTVATMGFVAILLAPVKGTRSLE